MRGTIPDVETVILRGAIPTPSGSESARTEPITSR